MSNFFYIEHINLNPVLYNMNIIKDSYKNRKPYYFSTEFKLLSEKRFSFLIVIL
jgi:hypothetical protein